MKETIESVFSSTFNVIVESDGFDLINDHTERPYAVVIRWSNYNTPQNSDHLLS